MDTNIESQLKNILKNNYKINNNGKNYYFINNEYYDLIKFYK